MRIGILGAGQLGRMLAASAHELGHQVVFYDPAPDACAKTVSNENFTASYDDEPSLEEFADSVDVISYEFENIPTRAIRVLAGKKSVFPPVKSLEVAQDRLSEKETFTSLDIPTTRFYAVDDQASLQAAAEKLGFPFMLKTRRLGYDGKGQHLVKDEDALAKIDLNHQQWLAENCVAFDRELSLIAARSKTGDVVFYPLTENLHKDGMLSFSLAPAPRLTDDLQAQAEDIASKLLEHLDHVGVLAIEFFCERQKLLVNEIAPRVHNSGHWTQDGCNASQFDNHVRAVIGAPLLVPTVRGVTGMWNIVGTVPSSEQLEKQAGTVHLYGKAERAGRKLGHINYVGDSESDVLRWVDGVSKI